MKSFDSDWEVVHSTKEWGMYPTEHVIRFVARNYYDTAREQVRILDYGCGAGAHTWYLAREGFDVYAFDGSSSAIRRVKQRLSNEGLEAHLTVCDALDIPYQDDYFDAVIDNVCVYGNKIDCIENMYKDIKRILKSGGKLLTSCFGTNTYGYGTGIELEPDTYREIDKGLLVNRGTTHFFTKESLLALLCRIFEIDKSEICIETIQYTDGGVAIEQFVALLSKK